MRRDPCTLSNYNQFLTTHTEVNLNVDFDNRVLSGDVILSLQSRTDHASRELVLDTSHLNVTKVWLEGRSCEWQMLPRSEPYGSPLKIQLHDQVQVDRTFKVKIETETTDKCTALGWMTPTQARSSHPYVYTPDVKSTYDFNITSTLPVIASGLPIGTRPSKDGSKTYSFHQGIPIPSYLFAVASGDVTTTDIGPRSKLATSPDFLAEAKWEFEESIEKYLSTIEKIVYPYQWSEYNLLVLPSAFPYGGMENPVYTYVTPTTVSGDRENVDLVAHELSHSYSGNLVTNATWEDFWLNEGWTTYLERRLQAALFGESYRDFSAIIGWKGLSDSVKQFGEQHEFTKLIPDLQGEDPDDAFSQVPYEKGYTFLSYLETQVGRDKWNKFIPQYFREFARKSLTSVEFKDYLISFFASDEAASNALSPVDWKRWLYAPGLPEKPKFDTTLADACYDLASKWQKFDYEPSQRDIDGWKAKQIVVFLDTVKGFDQQLSADRVRLMGDTYGFVQSKNGEVTSRYFGIALRSRLESAYQPTVDLLSNVGRMKYVRPLYRELNEANRELALATFEKNKDFYHPICRDLVEKDLGLKG